MEHENLKHYLKESIRIALQRSIFAYEGRNMIGSRYWDGKKEAYQDILNLIDEGGRNG